MLTPIGLLSIGTLAFGFLYFASILPLGAVSLPCVTALTSVIYFFIMPTLFLAGGNNEFFGMFLMSLEWMHFAVFLYIMGAMGACIAHKRDLLVNPAAPQVNEREINRIILVLLWAIAVGGATALTAMGKMNLLADSAFEFSDSRELLFLNMSFSLVIPLTLIVLIRDDFGFRSLNLLLGVLLILAQTGFRFRIMILLSAVVGSFALVRRIRMRALYVAPATVTGLLFVNAFGKARSYGNGVELSRI